VGDFWIALEHCSWQHKERIVILLYYEWDLELLMLVCKIEIG